MWGTFSQGDRPPPTSNTNTFDAGTGVAWYGVMARTLGTFVLLGSLAIGVGACGVGDGAADTDNRDEQLGIVCNATFTTTGSFVAGTPGRPADVTGCWPVGTWTFSAKVDQNDCPSPPSVLASYAFRVDRAVDPNPANDIGYEESYTWLGDSTMVHKVGVSEIASGCQGGIELFNGDKTQFWNFRPLLQDDGTIVGFGEYAVYDSPQTF